MVAVSPSATSVSLHTPLSNPNLILFVQSKECQQLHRKMVHRAAYVLQPTKPNLGEDSVEKAQAETVGQWINPRSPAVTACLSIPPDPTNHQWVAGCVSEWGLWRGGGQRWNFCGPFFPSPTHLYTLPVFIILYNNGHCVCGDAFLLCSLCVAWVKAQADAK
jgi:hypothetical protein